MVEVAPRRSSVIGVYEALLSAMDGKAEESLDRFLEYVEELARNAQRTAKVRRTVLKIFFGLTLVSIIVGCVTDGDQRIMLCSFIVVIAIAIMAAWGVTGVDPDADKDRLYHWAKTKALFGDWLRTLPLQKRELTAPSGIQAFLEDAASAEKRFIQDRVVMYIAFVHESGGVLKQITDAWGEREVRVKLGKTVPPVIDGPDPTECIKDFVEQMKAHQERAQFLANNLDEPMDTPEFTVAFKDIEELHRQIHDPSWHHALHDLGFRYAPMSSRVGKLYTSTKRVGGSYRVAPDTVPAAHPDHVPLLPPTDEHDETSESREPAALHRSVVH